MKVVGISMIRNDADIVEPFVRHTLRLLDHLFVIVHSPEDGTGEILKALHAEGLPMTLVFDAEPAFLQGERMTWLARQAFAAMGPDFVFTLDADEFIVPADRAAIEAALALLPSGSVAARIRLRSFVPTSTDTASEPHPLRRIRHRVRKEPRVCKVVLAPAFAADQALVIDHGNHAVVRMGPAPDQLLQRLLPQLALAHYPVRSAAQLTNKTVIGYLAHLAAGRPSVEEQRLATHWRHCYEEMVIRKATHNLNEAQLVGWFYGRTDAMPDADDLVCDPTPAPDTLHYAHLAHNDPYTVMARFTEALIRSRPGDLEGVRFDNAPSTLVTDDGSGSGEPGDRHES